MRGDWRDTVLPSLALFGSTSTLVCCALPALLISLGAGAVMASLTSAIPGIMWLSAHKDPLFIAAGVVLAISSMIGWQQRKSPCPIDPIKAAKLSADAQTQCVVTRLVMAGLRLRTVLRLPLGALFLMTVWKTDRHKKKPQPHHRCPERQ